MIHDKLLKTHKLPTENDEPDPRSLCDCGHAYAGHSAANRNRGGIMRELLSTKRTWVAMTMALSMVPLASQVCQASVQSPSPQVTSFSQSVDPRIVATAKEWFHRFQTGNIDRSQLDVSVNVELTNAMIAEEGAKLRQVGAPSSFRFIRTYANRRRSWL
jgi:hypothetical protein